MRERDINSLLSALCSVGRRFIHGFFGEPASWRQRQPYGYCSANPLPPVNAHQEPHGHHNPSLAPRRTWGAESGWAQTQEGTDVPLHLPRPDKGITQGPRSSFKYSTALHLWFHFANLFSFFSFISFFPFWSFYFQFLSIKQKIKICIYKCNLKASHEILLSFSI